MGRIESDMTNAMQQQQQQQHIQDDKTGLEGAPGALPWVEVSQPRDLRDLGGPKTGPFCSIAESRGQNASLVSF